MHFLYFFVCFENICNDDQSDQVAGDRRMTLRGLSEFFKCRTCAFVFFVFVVLLFVCCENVCKDDQCEQVAGDRRITFRN